MKVLHVVGARPDQIKVAPFIESMADEAATQRRRLDQILVHSGRHYSPELSMPTIGELGLPKPDITLDVGSGSLAVQTGQEMIAFEEAMKDHHPDLMISVGAVNSTIACALDTAKMDSAIVHVDEPCGLRSLVSLPVTVSQELPLLWPLHPRAKSQLELRGLNALLARSRCTDLPGNNLWTERQ